MNSSHHMACAWSGLAFVVLFTIGWFFVAGYIPPQSPAASAQQIADFYSANPTTVLIGLFIVMVATAILVPFMAEITIQMARMERRLPILATAQVCLGLVNVLEFLLASILWATAAFRPERDPQLILLLNDLGWMTVLWPMSGALIQNILIGACTLSYKGEAVIFPRWVGFFNLWFALLVIPAGLIPFFKSGPFAWNGALAFWLPAAAYLAWVAVMSAVLVGAVRRQAASPALSSKHADEWTTVVA